jgi:hypothetical protein
VPSAGQRISLLYDWTPNPAHWPQDMRATGLTWQSAAALATQLHHLTSLRLAGNKLGDKV